MARKVKGMVYTTIYPDAVSIRGLNRDTAVVKREVTKKFEAPNLIFIKALTANVGNKPGVRHELTKNKKIKVSTIGLSDEGLVELYMALTHYIKNNINNQIK
jgi:hypothetical protein